MTSYRESGGQYDYTVESRYLELGYLESRVISNWKSIPLKLIIHLYQLTMDYLELSYLETLTISNTLWGSLAYTNPAYLELIFGSTTTVIPSTQQETLQWNNLLDSDIHFSS